MMGNRYRLVIVAALFFLMTNPWVGRAAAQTGVAPRAASPLPSSTQNQTAQAPAATPTPSIPVEPSSTAGPLVPQATTGDDRLPFMADAEHEAKAREPGAAGLLMRTFGALLLIVGLIVAVAWGMRRFGGARFGTPREDAPELSVLNSVALGDRRSLAIVRFGERTLLIGSTAQAITLLAAEDAESDLPVPPIRSVAEMLKENEAGAFDHELSVAGQNFERMQGAWREAGSDV